MMFLHGFNPFFPLSTIVLFSQSFKAPYLLLCSENDDLAPYQTIVNFAQRLQELGADVKLVKWNGSPHVGERRDPCHCLTRLK